MKEEILAAKKILHQGGLVAHPTETCYGFAVDIFQRSAVQKLYNVKKMPLDKTVSILVRDLDEAKRYGEFSEKAIELAEKYWPGPLTIIVPRTALLPQWVNYGNDTVGIRCSSHRRTRELVEAFGGPLTTTSANIHGQPQAYSVEEILGQGIKPNFIIDGGVIAKNKPSTIVKVEKENVGIVRQGELIVDGLL